MSEEALQIAEKRREVKGKGERERYAQRNAEDPGLIPGLGRSQEKEMATHSSTLAWKTPWTKEPGRLQSKGLQRVRHD